MSFMYNPFPFDDPKPVNRPEISQETISSIIEGDTASVARKFSKYVIGKAGTATRIIAFDGYATARWEYFINVLGRECKAAGVDFEAVDANSECFKSNAEIDAMIDPMLEWDTEIDPTLLFGRIYKGGYEGMLDEQKTVAFEKRIASERKGMGKVIAVFGYGTLISRFLPLYDIKVFFDLTPKTSILRIRNGEYANIGRTMPDLINRVIRRCYYCDFEMAVCNRRKLIENGDIDFYCLSDNPDKLQFFPFSSFADICASLVKYPFRPKPCYIEGVWGGSYMKRLRNLPSKMRNCAWVFDFIPMEVSVLVEAGEHLLDINFCSFVCREGDNLMSKTANEKFHGYFPIRFNYDDSYHSTGNMSIQCHSGSSFNREHYGEFGRQDESYYVCVTGHDAKTYIGFRDDADIPQFFRDIEAADKEHKECDYRKYVNYEESRPGLQVMLPAGTIHSSGRNQVILEIGSLTIGSYTYKMYDYLRLDFDGKQRPIHTRLGEKNVVTRRRTSVIHNPASEDYIVQKPRIAAEGEGWKEWILGENEQLYFSLRRLDFETNCPQDTHNERFHVLALVDGDHVRVRSKAHPERYYDMDYLDIICVPADMGEYVIENLGREPVMVHKTMLRDGYNDVEL